MTSSEKRDYQELKRVVLGAAGKFAKDSANSQRKEQAAIEPDVNDPESYDDALINGKVEQLTVSLRASHSTTRNSAGAREVGLEAFNKRRLGNRVARVS